MWKEIIRNKKAALFDLDGTVVDSMWIWKQIDIDYFARFGLELPEDYQLAIEGMSFYETAVYTQQSYMPGKTPEDLMHDWNDMALVHYKNDVPAKEGVVRLLENLKSRGFRIGMVTSNSNVLCTAALEHNGLTGYFDAVITGEDCKTGKPAPDVYLTCAKKLGVAPSDCIVFEDLCNGIVSGNTAGMTTVAIKDDYSDAQWDEKCRLADHFITSYVEITDEIC